MNADLIHRIKLILFISILAVPSAWGADPIDPQAQIKLSEEHTVSGAKLIELQNQLKPLEQDQKYVHWTKPSVGMRWVRQGKIEPEELDFYNIPDPDKKNQSYGPGIYLARDPMSSELYGSFPVIFKVKKNTLVYSEKTADQVLGWIPNSLELAKIGEYIPWIREVESRYDWWVINHPDLVLDVTYGGSEGIAHFKELKELIENQELTPLRKLQKIQSIEVNEGTSKDPILFNPNLKDEYLEKLFAFSSRTDGLSFVRSIQANPGAPWTQGKQGTDAEAIQVSDAVKFALHGYRNAMDPDLFKKFQVAAESEPPNPVFVTPVQLMELKQNPYLTVTSEKVSEDGMGFLVSYSFPSVKNFKRVEDRLPKALLSELEAFSQGRETPRSREELDRGIVVELLRELFFRMNRRPSMSSLQIQRDFNSIRAFGNHTPQVAKLFSDAVLKEEYPSVVSFDRSLLFSFEVQQAINSDWNRELSSFVRESMFEMINSRVHETMPHYLTPSKVSQLENGLRSSLLGPSGDQKKAEVGWDIQSFDTLARVKDWVEKNDLPIYKTALEEGLGKILQRLLNASSQLTDADQDVLSDSARNLSSAARSELIGTLMQRAVQLQKTSTDMGWNAAGLNSFKMALLRLTSNEAGGLRQGVSQIGSVALLQQLRGFIRPADREIYHELGIRLLEKEDPSAVWGLAGNAENFPLLYASMKSEKLKSSAVRALQGLLHVVDLRKSSAFFLDYVLNLYDPIHSDENIRKATQATFDRGILEVQTPLEWIQKALNSPHKSVRALSIPHLINGHAHAGHVHAGHEPADNQKFEVLKKAFQSPDCGVQTSASQGLFGWEGPSVGPLLKELLDSQNPCVLEGALIALSLKIKKEGWNQESLEFLPILEKTLSSPYPAGRIQAAKLVQEQLAEYKQSLRNPNFLVFLKKCEEFDGILEKFVVLPEGSSDFDCLVNFMGLRYQSKECNDYREARRLKTAFTELLKKARVEVVTSLENQANSVLKGPNACSDGY